MKALYLTAPATLKATKGKGRRIAIVAYSGGLLRGVPNFGNVLIDLAGLEIPSSIPLNVDHENRIAATVGSGVPKTDGKLLTVSGTLAETEAAAEIVALLESGVELQASVEVMPRTITELTAGESVSINGQSIETFGETTLIDKGVLRAVALVQQAADVNTSARLAAKKGTTEMTKVNIESLQAKWQTLNEARKLDSRVCAIFANAFAGEATEKEVEHVLAMWVPRPINQSPPDESSRLIAIDNRPRLGGNGVSAADPRQGREVLAAALLVHAGAETAAVKAFSSNVMQAARDMNVRHTMDIVEASARMNPALHGVPADRGELIRASFGPSTYSLPSALSLAGDKLMQQSYAETPASWRSWTGRKSVTNFRTHTGLRPFFIGGSMDEVPRGGELKHAAADEETYTIAADTFGKLFTVDRRDLINDDLGVFVELFAEIGRQAPRKVSDLLYTALLTNAATFFGTGHANYIEGAGTVLSLASLGQAVTSLRKQKDGNGKPVALVPAVILVPPELEATAAAIVNSTETSRVATGDQLPTGNPWAGRMTVEVEPRLSDTTFHAGATAVHWYLFAPPSTPCAVVAFLNGREGPVTEQIDAPANVLGVSLRGYIDFGVALTDYRAGVRSKGSA